VSRLLDYLREHQEGMLADLRWLVEHESPTGDKPRLDSLAERVGRWGEEVVGARVTTIGSEAGDHVRLQVGGDDESHPLLLGHFDTVWAVGTLAERPFEVTNGRASGPGVFDMKAGIVQGMWALRALREVAGEVPPLVWLLTSDEEAGSLTSRALIEAEAARSSPALVLEPSERGLLKTSRKGVGLFRLEVAGVSAHAGIDPAAGASAIVELARQIVDLAQEEPNGTTVNVGVVTGGTRTNVVAQSAAGEIDLRVAAVAEADRMTARILGLQPHDRRTRVVVTGGMNRPPMERTPATAELYERAGRIAASLGFELGETATGGASDGNFCAAAGVPVLDGLGAVGGGAHARDEHVLVEHMAPRAALVAHLLLEHSRTG
jgi:glutamate carboxypeptidase